MGFCFSKPTEQCIFLSLNFSKITNLPPQRKLFEYLETLKVVEQITFLWVLGILVLRRYQQARGWMKLIFTIMIKLYSGKYVIIYINIIRVIQIWAFTNVVVRD